MKIYISGQISGLSKEEYVYNFKNAAYSVWKFFGAGSYKHIINPIDLKPFLGIKKWLFYMISDLWQLRKCTHIAMQLDRVKRCNY